MYQYNEGMALVLQKSKPRQFKNSTLPKSPQANTQTMRIATKTIRIFTTRRECVAHWTKLFATDEVVYNEPIIQNFLSLIDHMSCSADTYV